MLFIWVIIDKPLKLINIAVYINLYLYVIFILFIKFNPFVNSNIPVIKGCFIGNKLLIILKNVTIPKIDIKVLRLLAIELTKLNFLLIKLLFKALILIFLFIKPIIKFINIFKIIIIILSFKLRYLVNDIINRGLNKLHIDSSLIASVLLI